MQFDGSTSHAPLPALPKSWSELTWQQLCDCWQIKLRYGGNPDAARAAALLALCGLSDCSDYSEYSDDSDTTGEAIYYLLSPDGRRWSTTARELSHLAKASIGWFDYPYGDPGDKEVKDEKGNIIKERREGVRGYVSHMKDAMQLPIEEIGVASEKLKVKNEKSSLFILRSSLFTRWFQLRRPLAPI